MIAILVLGRQTLLFNIAYYVWLVSRILLPTGYCCWANSKCPTVTLLSLALIGTPDGVLLLKSHIAVLVSEFVCRNLCCLVQDLLRKKCFTCPNVSLTVLLFKIVLLGRHTFLALFRLELVSFLHGSMEGLQFHLPTILEQKLSDWLPAHWLDGHTAMCDGSRNINFAWHTTHYDVYLHFFGIESWNEIFLSGTGFVKQAFTKDFGSFGCAR